MKDPVLRLAAVSIDLDEAHCYREIHGLRPPAGASAFPIYAHAVPRFEHLFEQLGIKATFFAVGRDLQDAGVRNIATRLHQGGHELANHSYHHAYNLSRKPPEAMLQDVRAGSDAVGSITGATAVGFRAPGYVLSPALLDCLRQSGAAYDSSVFPCPPYYLAKLAALGLIRLRGRKSSSIVDDPRVLTAPAEPYQLGQRPWQRTSTREQRLVELPIGVTPWPLGRLPFIGTSLSLAGKQGARLLTRAMMRYPFINLELHGIDLAEPSDDMQDLQAVQPDLRRSLANKRTILKQALEKLRSHGYRFVTLSQAAARFETEH